jgi:hemerythrin-like domain-containing protein
VLATAGVPVLVAPISAPEHRAIAVLRDEHRAISAVIHACTSLLAGAREADGAADTQALRAALATLRDGALGEHHAREERHLFSRLRARTHELDGEIEELQRQHVRDEALLEELAVRITALEDAPGVALRTAATRALEQAMDRFAELHWEHMGREEAIMLPAARDLFTAEDWAGLDAQLVHAPGTKPASALDFRQLLAFIG